MDKERLLEFANAWKTKDLTKVMSFFTDDCIYSPSVGEQRNTSFVGKKEVSNGIKKMMNHEDVKDVVLSNIMVNESFGFWEWNYALKNGGTEVGCDVFEFSGPRIKVKNAFRKSVINTIN